MDLPKVFPIVKATKIKSISISSSGHGRAAFLIQRSPKIKGATRYRTQRATVGRCWNISTVQVLLFTRLYWLISTQVVFVFSITKDRNALRLPAIIFQYRDVGAYPTSKSDFPALPLVEPNSGKPSSIFKTCARQRRRHQLCGRRRRNGKRRIWKCGGMNIVCAKGLYQ